MEANVKEEGIPHKLMVCLSKRGNQGKTKTIRALAELIIPNSKIAKAQWHKPTVAPGSWQTCHGDICVATKAKNGKLVGLCSHGDVATTIKDWLEFLGNQNCDIIFCACHTRGTTVKAVKDKAKKYGYTIVWTAPYTNDTAPAKTRAWQEWLNKKKAEHLEDFI